jgi:hypothetical protein
MVLISYELPRRRGGSVGIVTGYGLYDWGVIPSRERDFSLFHSFRTGSPSHPASYPIGTGGSFPRIKRPGREADHSPLASAEVKKNVDLYTHFLIRFHGVVLNNLSTRTTLPLPYTTFGARCILRSIH